MFNDIGPIWVNLGPTSAQHDPLALQVAQLGWAEAWRETRIFTAIPNSFSALVRVRAGPCSLPWACPGPNFGAKPDAPTQDKVACETQLVSNVPKLPHVGPRFNSSWAQVGANWPEFGASYAHFGST